MRKCKNKMMAVILLAVGIAGMMYCCKLDVAARAGTGVGDKSGQMVRFVVMADSQGEDNGISEAIVRKAMECIKGFKQQPDFFVMPGDLVDGAGGYEKIKAQLENLKDILKEYYPETCFYRGAGNHEVSSGVSGIKASGEVFREVDVHYMTGMNKSVYYFDKGSSRFWMLDTDHKNMVGNVSDRVVDWIRKNYKISAQHNFFFVHEPQYPTGMTAFLVDKSKRDKLWKQIDSMNSPMVFSGHEHCYARRHIDAKFNEKVDGKWYKFTKSIYQVTIGGLNSSFYDNLSSMLNVDVKPKRINHFAVVEASAKRISVKVYDLDGKVIDAFSSR